jgi:hypothetical protein
MVFESSNAPNPASSAASLAPAGRASTHFSAAPVTAVTYAHPESVRIKRPAFPSLHTSTASKGNATSNQKITSFRFVKFSTGLSTYLFIFNKLSSKTFLQYSFAQSLLFSQKLSLGSISRFIAMFSHVY